MKKRFSKVACVILAIALFMMGIGFSEDASQEEKKLTSSGHADISEKSEETIAKETPMGETSTEKAEHEADITKASEDHENITEPEEHDDGVAKNEGTPELEIVNEINASDTETEAFECAVTNAEVEKYTDAVTGETYDVYASKAELAVAHDAICDCGKLSESNVMIITLSVSEGDANGHECDRLTAAEFECSDNGKYYLKGNRSKDTEAHSFNSENGKCSICKYECAHNDVEITAEPYGGTEYNYTDTKKHDRIETILETETCKVCGFVTQSSTTKVTEETHSCQPVWSADGKSIEKILCACGYEPLCQGASEHIWNYEAEDIVTRSCSPKDASAHTVTEVTTPCAAKCTVCGIDAANTAEATERKFDEPHKYDPNGHCEDCGEEAKLTRITASSMTLINGASGEISYKLEPTNISANMSYAVKSGETYVDVSSGGIVMTKAVGEAIIEIKAVNSYNSKNVVKCEIKVTVNKPGSHTILDDDIFFGDDDTTTSDDVYSSEIDASSVTFGSYEQDGDLDNGAEPIEWIVLAQNGSDRLLISKYAIDTVAFEDTEAEADWEHSSLRRYLNNDFLTYAFSDAEREKLITTSILSETDPKRSSEDKVYVLSVDEVANYFPDTAKCVPSEAVKGWMETQDKTCAWWLRTPGCTLGGAAFVDASGNIDRYGARIGSTKIAVRPVIYVRNL